MSNSPLSLPNDQLVAITAPNKIKIVFKKQGVQEVTELEVELESGDEKMDSLIDKATDIIQNRLKK